MSAATRTGDQAWAKSQKTNAELFALTYGVLVTQIIADYEDLTLVNEQLESLGFNIGVRLIDEYLAKQRDGGSAGCRNFLVVGESIAKIGFKMFLGVQCDVKDTSVVPSQDKAGLKSFSLLLPENPLTTFVDLPSSHENLKYSNILCGVIRGSLSAINMKVKCTFKKDVLLGDEVNEISVMLEEMMRDDIGEAFKEE